jgi:hypothetical protein
MKPLKIIFTFFIIASCQLVSGQSRVEGSEKWNFLIGDWNGEGNGQPGKGEGKFSFRKDLDGKILIRTNHTVFPATTGSPEKVHNDLLIVYPVSRGTQQEAIYFDNEGNTIKYKVSFTENSIIMTSDVAPDVPRFRLTYLKIDINTVNITFEMASPEKPEEFKIYLSGKAFKEK